MHASIVFPLRPSVAGDRDSFDTEFKAGLTLLTAAIHDLERLRAQTPAHLHPELQQQQRLLDSALWQFQRALSCGRS